MVGKSNEVQLNLFKRWETVLKQIRRTNLDVGTLQPDREPSQRWNARVGPLSTVMLEYISHNR